MKRSRKTATGRATSRRHFLQTVGSAAALTAVGVSGVDAGATDLPKLDESDPTAVSLKYVHDASAVADTLRPQKDRYCFNCALYAGKESDDWAACGIFPGKAVAGSGWCSVWAPKQRN
jgi:hypothetical protein